MYEKDPYPATYCEITLPNIRAANPTLRENITQKIKWHQDEIERLKAIEVKMVSLLDVNLRDLREAMNF